MGQNLNAFRWNGNWMVIICNFISKRTGLNSPPALLAVCGSEMHGNRGKITWGLVFILDLHQESQSVLEIALENLIWCFPWWKHVMGSHFTVSHTLRHCSKDSERVHQRPRCAAWKESLPFLQKGLTSRPGAFVSGTFHGRNPICHYKDEANDVLMFAFGLSAGVFTIFFFSVLSIAKRQKEAAVRCSRVWTSRFWKFFLPSLVLYWPCFLWLSHDCTPFLQKMKMKLSLVTPSLSSEIRSKQRRDLSEGTTLHGPAHNWLYQHTRTPASPWDRRGLCPHFCTPAHLQAQGIIPLCFNIFVFQQRVA